MGAMISTHPGMKSMSVCSFDASAGVSGLPRLKSSTLCNFGLYSYGLYSYGLFSYGIYGYGICSYGGRERVVPLEILYLI